jgi:hypothetical protein
MFEKNKHEEKKSIKQSALEMMRTERKEVRDNLFNQVLIWILIIFMFYRSLFRVVFIPHEYCKPYNTVHPSTQGGLHGGFLTLRGLGESGPLKEKLPCKCIL